MTQDAQKVEKPLQQGKELVEAREKTVESWIRKSVNDCIDSWKQELDESENGQEADLLIRLKLASYLLSEAVDFVSGDSDSLPSYTGHMTRQTINTESGAKPRIIKIEFGSYTGSNETEDK